MPMSMTKERAEAFLADLSELTRRHGIKIAAASGGNDGAPAPLLFALPRGPGSLGRYEALIAPVLAKGREPGVTASRFKWVQATLCLIRGLPGTGKSTLARKLVAENPGMVRFEADMFFERDGEYRFDGARIKEAHEWCRESTENALKSGQSVVVANTFTQLWEMVPYREMADRVGADIVILEMFHEYGSTHGVPPEHIEKMRKRWEPLE